MLKSHVGGNGRGVPEAHVDCDASLHWTMKVQVISATETNASGNLRSMATCAGSASLA